MTQTPPPAPPLTAALESALYADDLDAAEAFYGELLALERVQRVPGRHVFFRVGRGMLLVFDPAGTEAGGSDPRLPVPPHGARGPGHFCFAVPGGELAEWHARLTAAGVEIEQDFHWPNGARSIYFRDPAGNSIEMAEPWLWD